MPHVFLRNKVAERWPGWRRMCYDAWPKALQRRSRRPGHAPAPRSKMGPKRFGEQSCFTGLPSIYLSIYLYIYIYVDMFVYHLYFVVFSHVLSVWWTIYEHWWSICFTIWRERFGSPYSQPEGYIRSYELSFPTIWVIWEFQDLWNVFYRCFHGSDRLVISISWCLRELTSGKDDETWSIDSIKAWSTILWGCYNRIYNGNLWGIVVEPCVAGWSMKSKLVSERVDLGNDSIQY